VICFPLQLFILFSNFIELKKRKVVRSKKYIFGNYKQFGNKSKYEILKKINAKTTYKGVVLFDSRPKNAI
jgi:hypothetical protein